MNIRDFAVSKYNPKVYYFRFVLFDNYIFFRFQVVTNCS